MKPPQTTPPRRSKRKSNDPTRDVLNEIVETEKTKEGLLKRLLWFWAVSTAEAQHRGYELAEKAKEEHK